MVYRAPCFFGPDVWKFKIKCYFCSAITEVAQSVEHWSPKPGVGSSSLSFRAKKEVASGKRPLFLWVTSRDVMSQGDHLRFSLTWGIGFRAVAPH